MSIRDQPQYRSPAVTLNLISSKKDELRVKARERAARYVSRRTLVVLGRPRLLLLLRAKLRRMESETPEEAEERRSRHREAAARYREANRTKIRLKAQERRYAQYSQ